MKAKAERVNRAPMTNTAMPSRLMTELTVHTTGRVMSSVSPSHVTELSALMRGVTREGMEPTWMSMALSVYGRMVVELIIHETSASD